jgi:hypothetical protein
VDEGRHGAQVVMPLPPVSRRDYLKALVETAIFAPALISSSEAAADPLLPPLPNLSDAYSKGPPLRAFISLPTIVARMLNAKRTPSKREPVLR